MHRHRCVYTLCIIYIDVSYAPSSYSLITIRNNKQNEVLLQNFSKWKALLLFVQRKVIIMLKTLSIQSTNFILFSFFLSFFLHFASFFAIAIVIVIVVVVGGGGDVVFGLFMLLLPFAQFSPTYVCLRVLRCF